MDKADWPTAEAEIVNCSVSWLRSDFGNSFTGQPASSTYKAEYVYEVNGAVYRHSMTISSPDRVGEKFTVAYNPDNPDRNDAPDQTLNLKDSRSILRHALIWGAGILLVVIIAHFFPRYTLGFADWFQTKSGKLPTRWWQIPRRLHPIGGSLEPSIQLSPLN